jgi:protein TonB
VVTPLEILLLLPVVPVVEREVPLDPPPPTVTVTGVPGVTEKLVAVRYPPAPPPPPIPAPPPPPPPTTI